MGSKIRSPSRLEVFLLCYIQLIILSSTEQAIRSPSRLEVFLLCYIQLIILSSPEQAMFNVKMRRKLNTTLAIHHAWEMKQHSDLCILNISYLIIIH